MCRIRGERVPLIRRSFRSCPRRWRPCPTVRSRRARSRPWRLSGRSGCRKLLLLRGCLLWRRSGTPSTRL
ncbi:hypothetical protein ACFPRL_32045 [Pseudoclavibacter helvolus]